MHDVVCLWRTDYMSEARAHTPIYSQRPAPPLPSTLHWAAVRNTVTTIPCIALLRIKRDPKINNK